MKRNRKIADDNASFEKFVTGVTVLMIRSCMILKSSMQF